MTTNPAFDTFIVGILCGAVLGAAAALSRRLLGLLFGLGVALMIFVVVNHGVAGLEAEVRRLIDQALLHQQLLLGTVVGFFFAASFFDRTSTARERER